MISEDQTFFLWEVVCDHCHKVVIIYEEDADTKEDLKKELVARGWMLVKDQDYCKECGSGRKYS